MKHTDTQRLEAIAQYLGKLTVVDGVGSITLMPTHTKKIGVSLTSLRNLADALLEKKP